MESDERTDLLNYYKIVHIQRKYDKLEKLKEKTIKYLNSVPFEKKFVTVQFEILLQEIISRKQARKANDFLQIQQGFGCLEKYGLKLLQCPWRKEFHTIKLYSSYFKHDIETSIPIIVASALLKLYGYTEKAPEILELENSSPSSSTLETAFELFLSTIELGVLYKIAKDVDDKVTLNEVLKSRVKTTGDEKNAKSYLYSVNGISNLPKRIKLDEPKQSNISRKDHNINYPPEGTRTKPEQRSSSKNSSSGKARQELISTTNGLDISDHELYGAPPDPVDTHPTPTYTNQDPVHIHPTLTFAKHYPQPMDYDDDIYESMSDNASYNIYESMNVLPKPEELPPPNYNQAVDPHFPENMKEDWVMVESESTKHEIPGMSGLKIDDNGPSNTNGVRQVNTLRTHNGNLLENRKAVPTAFKQERMEMRGPEPSELMYLETAKGILGSPLMPSTSSQVNELPRATGPLYSSVAKESNNKKGYTGKNDEFLNGYEKRQAQSRLPIESANVPSKASKQLHGNNYKMLTNVTTNQKSSSMPSNSAETLPSSLAQEKLSSERYKTTATNGIMTPPVTSSVNAQSVTMAKPETMMPHQKQTALQKDLQETNQSEELEKCSICKKEASYMCGLCDEMACEQCKGFLNSYPCGTSPSMHQLLRVGNSKEKQSSKADVQTCHYCTKPATHSCHVCRKKSCSVCHLLPHDDCTSSMGHIFRSNTSIEPQISDIQRELNDSYYCDFCRLSATFICGDCHNRTCKSCMKIYEKDLCPETKKAHYFHLISSQTKIDPKEKAWSCGRCTYSNPPQNKICAICATSRGVTEVQFPRSGSRKCRYCTYGNAEGSRICEMCSRSLDRDTVESYI